MFGDVYCDAESGKFDMNCGISPLFFVQNRGKNQPPSFLAADTTLAYRSCLAALALYLSRF